MLGDMDRKHAGDEENSEIPTGIPIVKRTSTSTGVRISTVIKQEASDEAAEAETLLGLKLPISVNEEVPDSEGGPVQQADPIPTRIKQEKSESEQSYGAEAFHGTNPESVQASEDPETQEDLVVKAVPVLALVKQERVEEFDEVKPLSLVPSQAADSQEGLMLNVQPIKTLVKLENSDEAEEGEMFQESNPESAVKKEASDYKEDLSQQEEKVKKIRSVLGSEIPELGIRALSECGGNPDVPINFILENQAIELKKTSSPISTRVADSQKVPESKVPAKKEDPDCKVTLVRQARPKNLEDGDFPEERDWILVGRTFVTALSTSKGNKLFDNEIVHFIFPSANSTHKTRWIARFATKRFGEIGRLPMEWAKCVIPLVCSGKVKVLGRCIDAPKVLYKMQEVILYLSFYIHHSVFTEGDHSSWRLDVSPTIDSSIYPLLALFKLLKLQPYKKAEFTPKELDSRKRLLNIERIPDEGAPVLPLAKRRKGVQQPSQESKDEQALTESSLNKIVGAADVYDLEEMEPPSTLTCVLKPYQKQALYWMSELEKGIDVEKATQTLHPCWAAYHICDERVSSVYVNIFTGETTTKFPTATQMARGILADAMGLGKTDDRCSNTFKIRKEKL